MEVDPSVIAAFTILFICLLIGGITTWRKHKNSEELKDLVAWCVYDNDNLRYNLPLFAYIKNAQNRYNVIDKYRISGNEEWDYVKEVISRFQEQLVQSFFRGALSRKKSIYVIHKEDFFIFRLFCFLSEHAHEGSFWEHDIYEKQISCKSYGMWGGPMYDAVYEFSKFGRTVHKLYYITYLYCKESLIYKDDLAGWLTPEYFTEDLDSNQIRISRC